MSRNGKSLAHYSITAEIGKGGMGEVYQAKDTKLGRDVEVKSIEDEKILGGVLLKFGSLNLDGSLKNMLNLISEEVKGNIEKGII